MHLKQNIGRVERAFRGGLGVILLLVGWLLLQGVYREILSNLIILIGFVLLVEGALGWCAGYALLNMEAVERKSRGK